MKKLLFACALIAVLLPSAPQAKSQDISVSFFYDNLSGGSWVEVGDYGYCWQPDLASDPSWRPYSDGYWAYTDLGWTWVSYEDFGWATYHYGRWIRLADAGWVWVPGYRWGPAWVSWRFGGGYCGWAPLPPETEVVYESRPLSGHIDIEFDIGPAYYNFIDVRYIGEPYLRQRIVDVNQNITYVNQTVNVTNITYKNKTVYNYGPDLNTVNQFSSRPVPQLKLERQTNVDVATAARSGNLFKPQGNALVVAAPAEIKKAAAPLPPPAVKTKIAQPKLEKGWSVAGDANAQTQLKEKIKSQNLKNIPPPTAGANAAAATGAGASVPPGASVAPGMMPVEKGKKKGKGAEQFQAGATASPGGAVTSPTAGAAFPGKGKRKGKGAEEFQPSATASPEGGLTSPAASPAFPERGKRKGKAENQPGAATSPMTGPTTGMSPATAPEYGKPGKGKRGEKFGESPSPGEESSKVISGGKGKMPPYRGSLGPTPGGATSPTENMNEPRGGKHKQLEQPGMTPSAPQNTSSVPPNGPYGEGRGKHKQFEQPQPGPSQQGAQGLGPSGEERGKRRTEGMNASPAGGQGATGQAPEGKHEGKGKGAATATPGPQ